MSCFSFWLWCVIMNPLVLVVDDDKLLRTMVSDALADIACRIESAASGKEAIEYMAREKPAVMVLDLMMPEKSGLEVLSQFGRDASTKIVVLSSIDTQSLIAQAMKMGAFGFVTKPFHPLDIQSMVRSALESWGRGQ
jgi:two-component system, chemotaxis family, chemotaxis protein CheY